MRGRGMLRAGERGSRREGGGRGWRGAWRRRGGKAGVWVGRGQGSESGREMKPGRVWDCRDAGWSLSKKEWGRMGREGWAWC